MRPSSGGGSVDFASPGHLPGHRRREQIEGTGGGEHLAGSDPQVSGSGRQTTMAEQKLDGSDIGSRFQQMNRERVAQGLLILLIIFTPQRFALGVILSMAQKLK